MYIDIKHGIFLTPELTEIKRNKFTFNRNQKCSLNRNTRIQ